MPGKGIRMTISVVVVGVGNVGRRAIAGVVAHPDLELVGVWTSTPHKVGNDAATLAGLDALTGVHATADLATIIHARPDCVIHCGPDDRAMAAIAEVRGMLGAGINVVTSGLTFLQYPWGSVTAPTWQAVDSAAKAGEASFWSSGLDPGFATDWMPMALTGMCARIDSVRCIEAYDVGSYANGWMLRSGLGLGLPPEEATARRRTDKHLMAVWGGVVRQLAAALDVQLEGVDLYVEQAVADKRFETATGPVEQGTVAALHFEVVGRYHGRPAFVLEHVTRMRDDVAPEWPTLSVSGCYQVQVRGDPDLTLELRLDDAAGDHNTAAMTATAMRLVHAVPEVVSARPGLLTALDLPTPIGRGLMR